MPYRIEIINHPDYLHLKLSGTWDQQTAYQISRDVATAFSRSPHEKVLADFREVETSGLAEYHQAKYAVDLFSGIRHQIAALQLAPLVHAKAHELVAFIDLVATSRGLHYRIFHEEADAIAWLMGKR